MASVGVSLMRSASITGSTLMSTKLPVSVSTGSSLPP